MIRDSSGISAKWPLPCQIDFGIGEAFLAADLFGAIGEGAAAVGEGAGALAEGIGAGAGAIGEGIGAGVGAVGDTIGAGAGALGDTIGAGVNDLGAAVNSVLSPAAAVPSDPGLAAVSNVGFTPPAELGSPAPGLEGFPQGTFSNIDNALQPSLLGSETPAQGIGPLNEVPQGAEVMGSPENVQATLQQAAAQGDLGSFDAMVTNAQGDVSPLGSFQPASDVATPGASPSFDTFAQNFSPSEPGAALDQGGVFGQTQAGVDLGQGPADSMAAAASSPGASSPSMIDNVLKYGKLGLGAASLGLGLMRGNQDPKAARPLSEMGTQQMNVSKEFLGMAQRNEITPQQQAIIDQYTQSAQAKLYQFYAQNGQDPTKNTDYLTGLQQIQNQAIQMHQQFVDQLFKEGMQAGGGASANFTNLANEQIQKDQNLSKAVAAAASALGGGGGINLKVA